MNSLWLIIILLFSIAFFAGMEVSFISSNKLRFELEIKPYGLISRILMFYFNYASFFITVCRVGYTLTLGLLSICAIHVIHPYIIPVIPTPVIPIIIEITMVT